MMIRRGLIGLFLLLILVLPVVIPAYQVTLMNYIGLGSLVALGLVLLTGVGGLTSFGQAAFVGIGAYTTAFLTTTYGLSPWFTLPLGLIACGIVAYLLGFITLRLQGHYLALSTIAWSLSLFFLVGTFESLGGRNGMTGLPAISIFGYELSDPRSYSYLIWGCVAAGLLSVHNLLHSRPGRAIRVLRARSMMAEAFGIDTAHMRTVIFVHAALLAALSGWLFAHLVRFVSPTPFGVNASIEALFMAVLGGASSIWGAVVGATVITLLRDRIEDVIGAMIGVSGSAEIIAFGVLMVIMLQRARTGIVPFLARLLPPAPPAAIPASAPPLPTRERPSTEGAILEVSRIVRRFGGLVAVNEISFTVRRGDILGVIGPNGAGKSTLFNLVTGVLKPNDGEIRIAGQRTDRLPSRDIAALGIARTFQHVQLRSDMSALENVALGAHLRVGKGVLAAVLRLDRDQEASLLAEAARQIERVGLGAHMHEAAGNLALGQQRILEIARALAADPLLLLLDEPAAGLRYAEKQALAEVLKQLRSEGISILIVEHDMDFVMNLVDRLVVMDFGTQIATGQPADIQAHPKVQEAYLGVAA
jgi:branched-chain amino acid transport system permease protein